METVLSINLAARLLTLCGAVFPLASSQQTHPTIGECHSPESAARTYLELISGRSASELTLQADDWSNELSGFKVYDESGDEIAGVVVRDADCTLAYFSDLAIE